jgi:hypothetical protein
LKSRIDQYVINNVREKRLALGLSQLELGHTISVWPALIDKVESEKTDTNKGSPNQPRNSKKRPQPRLAAAGVTKLARLGSECRELCHASTGG